MYSLGETFVFETDEEEKVLSVVGDIVIKGKEYIIGEDDASGMYVFWYNDADEELEYIDDTEQTELLLEQWQEEYYGTIDEVGLWEEDYEEKDEYDGEGDYFIDEDNDDESAEDMDSYIDDLMDDDEQLYH